MSELMSDDFPTLDRPEKTTSGRPGSGSALKVGAAASNSARVMPTVFTARLRRHCSQPGLVCQMRVLPIRAGSAQAGVVEADGKGVLGVAIVDGVAELVDRALGGQDQQRAGAEVVVQ